MKNNFRNNVFKLMSGTALSQLLLVVSSPILTRMYSPEDFGIYTLFTSVIAIVTIIATGKYELSIVTPEKESEATILFKVTCILITIVSLVLLLLVSLVNLLGYAPGNMSSLLLFLFPVALFIMSFNSLLNYWLIRQAKFTIISISSIIQTVVTLFLQLYLFRLYFDDGSFSLVFALIISHVVTVLMILYLVRKDFFGEMSRKANVTELLSTAKKYIEYPKYMIFANFFNRMTIYAPVFVFSYFFPPAIVGYFGLAQRAIRLPMTVIGKSVSDVFFKNASDLYWTDKSKLELQTRKLVKGMFLLALIPSLVLLLFSENLFLLFFGPEWGSAGTYASILSVAIMFQFIFSPLSRIFQLYGEQKMYQRWELLRFILIILGMAFSLLFHNAIITAMFYTATLSISYLSMGWMVRMIFKKERYIEK